MEKIEDLKKLTVPQLKVFLEKRGLSTEGLKLKQDLFEHAAAALKTESSVSTTEKTPAKVDADSCDRAVVKETTKAPVTQQPATSPLYTAADHALAGANGGQTSEYGRQSTDDDLSQFDADAQRLWLEERMHVSD